MSFALNPSDQDKPIPKDRSNVFFGPVNADVTIDVPEIQVAAEQARQQAAAGNKQVNVNVSTFSAALASGYWYQPDGTGSLNANAFAHGSGYAVPFFIYDTSQIDAIGIVVTDGTAGGVANPGNYYRTRLGIYAEYQGVPRFLVTQTAQFSYGDGSIPNNTFYIDNTIGQVLLTPGRYWLVFRRSSNANLGNPAYVRFRDGNASGTPMKGPFPAGFVVSGSGYADPADAICWNLDFVAGSTGPGTDFEMDMDLDFWAYALGPSNYAPDMWIRGV